jgi:hypothetical protein
MKTKKTSYDWKLMSMLEIAFWSGAFIISLVSIILILRSNDFLLYNIYISGISVIAIIIFTIIFIRKLRENEK